MTWTKLLANKQARRHKTSKKELDNMRALIARDVADASLPDLSADRRFATAYNAALQAANIAIACAGYQIMSKVGHHRLSLESTKLVLDVNGNPNAFAVRPSAPVPVLYAGASIRPNPATC